MYFWNIEKLKETVKNGELSEKDKFIYFVIYVTLMVIGGSSGLPLLIAAVGLFCAYRANGGGTGADFFGRFFSIGVVIMIRLFVVFIPIFLSVGAYLYYVYIKIRENDVNTWNVSLLITLFIALQGGWFLLKYWLICKHIEDVCRKAEAVHLIKVENLKKHS